MNAFDAEGKFVEVVRPATIKLAGRIQRRSIRVVVSRAAQDARVQQRIALRTEPRDEDIVRSTAVRDLELRFDGKIRRRSVAADVCRTSAIHYDVTESEIVLRAAEESRILDRASCRIHLRHECIERSANGCLESPAHREIGRLCVPENVRRPLRIDRNAISEIFSPPPR